MPGSGLHGIMRPARFGRCDHTNAHSIAHHVVAIRQTANDPVTKWILHIDKLVCDDCGVEFAFYPERGIQTAETKRALRLTIAPGDVTLIS